MQKIVTILWLILFSSPTFAQNRTIASIFPLTDSKIYYEKVILTDSLKKEEIYKKLKTFALDLYTSQKDALQADDKETGILFYHGYFETIRF